MTSNDELLTELDEPIGQKIRKIRDLEGTSRVDFARQIEANINTLKSIEYGNVHPSGKVLISICSHPMYRKYTLYLMCEPWDENDYTPDFPVNIEQTTPDALTIDKLQAKLDALKEQQSKKGKK